METRRFASSILTAYIKGEVKLENNNMLTIKIPNSILTFIPLGTKNVSVPVSQISSVGTNFYLDFKLLVIGLIITLIGLSGFRGIDSLGSFIQALLFTAIGAAECINAFHVYLTIRNTSGEIIGSTLKIDKKGNIHDDGIPFIIFQKSIAEEIKADIDKLCSQRVDDTNVRIQNQTLVEQMQASTQAIIDSNRNQNS